MSGLASSEFRSVGQKGEGDCVKFDESKMKQLQFQLHHPPLSKSVSTGSINKLASSFSKSNYDNNSIIRRPRNVEGDDGDDDELYYSEESHDRRSSMVFPITPVGNYFGLKKRNDLGKEGIHDTTPVGDGQTFLPNSSSDTREAFSMGTIDPLLLEIQGNHHPSLLRKGFDASNELQSSRSQLTSLPGIRGDRRSSDSNLIPGIGSTTDLRTSNNFRKSDYHHPGHIGGNNGDESAASNPTSPSATQNKSQGRVSTRVGRPTAAEIRRKNHGSLSSASDLNRSVTNTSTNDRFNDDLAGSSILSGSGVLQPVKSNSIRNNNTSNNLLAIFPSPPSPRHPISVHSPRPSQPLIRSPSISSKVSYQAQSLLEIPTRSSIDQKLCRSKVLFYDDQNLPPLPLTPSLISSVNSQSSHPSSLYPTPPPLANHTTLPQSDRAITTENLISDDQFSLFHNHSLYSSEDRFDPHEFHHPHDIHKNSNLSSQSFHHQSSQRHYFNPHHLPTPSSRSEDHSHYEYAPSNVSYSADNSRSESRINNSSQGGTNLSSWAPVPQIPINASEPNPKNLPDWKFLKNDVGQLTSTPISSIREDFDFSLRKLITESVFEDILDDQLARHRFRDWLNKNQMTSAISKMDLWLDSRTFTRLIGLIKRGSVGIHDIYLNPQSNGLVKFSNETREDLYECLQQIMNIRADKTLLGVERDLLKSLFNNEFQSFLKHLVVSQVQVRLGKYNLSEDDKDGLGDCFCLTNPRMRDHPIVLVSGGFTKVTGYSKKQIIGRNCRFLQGPGTAPQSVQRIRDGLNSGEGCTELLLNYRRDGTPFYCLLCIIPLRDATGSLVYFIGGQINVTGMFSSKKGLSFLFGDQTSEFSQSASAKEDEFQGIDRLGKGKFQLSPSMQKYSKTESTELDSIGGNSKADRLVLPGDGYAAGSIHPTSGGSGFVDEEEKNTGFKANGLDGDFNEKQVGGGFFRRLLAGKPKEGNLKPPTRFGMSNIRNDQRLLGAEGQIGGAKSLEDQLKVFESTYSKIIVFKRENRQMIFATKQVLQFLGLPCSSSREIYKSNLIQKDFAQLIWPTSDMNSGDNSHISPHEIREYVKKTIKAGMILSLDCQVKSIERNYFFSKSEKLSKMKNARIHLTPLQEMEEQVVAYVCIMG